VTVVDTRGRPGSRRAAPPAPAAAPPGEAPSAPGPTVVRAARGGGRPGAGAAALLALVVTLAGVSLGALLHDPAGLPVFIAFVLAAPLAAGVVRRGRSLPTVVLCLPLVFAAAVLLGAVLEAVQGGSPVTVKSVGLTTAQVAVLHAPWLWAGTALAALVALRRRGRAAEPRGRP